MDWCHHEKKPCCEKLEENINLKGGKMDKKLIMWIVIAILLVAMIYVTFFKGSVDANTIGATQTSVQTASSMVGGC